jgi:hypothetical protein
MLTQPAFSFRFRLRTEFTDYSSDVFTSNVNSCNVDLLNKTLDIKVRHPLDVDFVPFVKNILKTKPDFVLDLLANDDEPHHSIIFRLCKIEKHAFSVDYSISETITHQLLVTFEDFKSVKAE